jgi:hypothetical protein
MLGEFARLLQNVPAFALCTSLIMSVRRLGGYNFAENPDNPASDALIAWNDRLNPACAKIAVQKTGLHQKGFTLDRFAGRTSVVIDRLGVEHVVIGNAASRFALDVVSGSMLNGPVALTVLLENMQQSERQLSTVQTLLRVHNAASIDSFPSQCRKSNARLILALRAHDALITGASHREIAEGLFGQVATDRDWHGSSDFLKSRVRRLVATAQSLAAGGWRSLLR